ncbi:hypothetical protein Ddc_21944 [Ditylenchus destructor]|nr:hypothetical protein Ddc_21944 [Ditylenchus destructor]
MQNLAANFPQLPFLGPISSAANGNPTAPNPTTTNANSGSHPDQDAQENGGAGQEQQSQFGMDSANLQQLMLAAANSNVKAKAKAVSSPTRTEHGIKRLQLLRQRIRFPSQSPTAPNIATWRKLNIDHIPETRLRLTFVFLHWGHTRRFYVWML